MAIKPLRDRVVVKAIREEMTKSGIVLPETKEKPQQGEVIAVGEGKFDDTGKRIPMDVKVGDKVLYSKYGGADVKLEDEQYIVLREDDILAIITE